MYKYIGLVCSFWYLPLLQDCEIRVHRKQIYFQLYLQAARDEVFEN